MKSKTKVDFSDAEKIARDLVSPEMKKKVGDSIVEEMKTMIGAGTSPVRGQRRFPAYKNRKNYPGDLKPARPVNLNLTGKMLSYLGWKHGEKKSAIAIGMIRPPAKEADKAKAHNEGTENMAQRQFIPNQGEEFAVSIMRKIKRMYDDRIKELIGRSSKKK